METFDFKDAVPNILVVDDDDVVRLLLRQFLEGAGYNVVESEDGYQAMARIAERQFDLVIMDIAMPGINGHEVCEQIRTTVENPPPLFMITAFDDEESVDRSFRAGAVDYIHKPIRWSVLKNRIRYIIGAQRSKLELKNLSRSYSLILDAAANGICGLDKNRQINYINPVALEMLGYSREEVMGLGYDKIFRLSEPGTDEFELDCCPFFAENDEQTSLQLEEIRLLRKDKSSFPVDFRCTPIIEDHQLAGAVLVFQDITERQRAQEMIRHMANHDSLTKLPNRNYFDKRLPQAISLAKRYERKLFLMFIDLDRFKNVNDTYGHSVGDQVLVEVGERLTSMLRTSDSICRLGGDEFVILLESTDTTKGAEHVASKMIKLLNKPIKAGNGTCKIGASIGISCFPDDSDDAESMIRHGDIAMYRAKQTGRNCWVFYKDMLKTNSLNNKFSA